jgi:hypothetical protein
VDNELFIQPNLMLLFRDVKRRPRKIVQALRHWAGRDLGAGRDLAEPAEQDAEANVAGAERRHPAGGADARA